MIYKENRSLKSIYGINLHLDASNIIEVTQDWCVLNTYDGWTPMHNHPVSKNKWKNLLQSISTKEGFSIHGITESGQGHDAILEKD